VLGTDARTFDLENGVMERVASTTTPQPVIAIAERRSSGLAAVKNAQWVVIADRISDPGNLGTIIRTADWFGVKQIFVSEDTAGFYNPKVLQSTMGSCFRVRVESVNLETIVKATALPVYGALLDGASMYESVIASTGFLIIGNESKGISNQLTKYITHPIKIPKYGHAESLNASVATGIILSHWKV
jgi:TrmH family RNA methyltransferase